MDAAHYLQVYDIERIYSWTPREFKNFIKGAQLRKIDAYESSAVAAMFNAKVKGKKRAKLKDIYDADKARKELDTQKKTASTLNLERYRKAQEAMKNYQPQTRKKGG